MKEKKKYARKNQFKYFLCVFYTPNSNHVNHKLQNFLTNRNWNWRPHQAKLILIDFEFTLMMKKIGIDGECVSEKNEREMSGYVSEKSGE